MGSETAGRRRPLETLVLRPTLGEGGADRVTLTLLRELDRDRFAPSLALMRPEGVLLGELPAGVPLHSLGGGRLWTAWWPLARLLRRERPDVLFSTSGGTNVIACVATLLAGKRHRLVLSERGLLLRASAPVKRRLLLWLKRWLYPLADCVTAVSRQLADDLGRRLRLAPERLAVVYNPVVTPELDDLAASEVTHPWVRDEPPWVLAVGRLVPDKGLADLIEAISRVRDRKPVRLMILGEGPERSALEDLVRRRGLEESVELPGFDVNPFRFMARCDLFVLSSHNEGLPGALIQAMACGAAVVATDCPTGPSEIVTDGEDGVLVPVGDPVRLGREIEQLLDDPRRRSEMGRRARRSARRFRLEASLERYQEALAGEAAPPAGGGGRR